MNIRTQILVVVLAAAALFWIIRKICRKGIEVKYSLLWILLGIGVIIFACFPPVYGLAGRAFRNRTAHQYGIFRRVLLCVGDYFFSVSIRFTVIQ